ncbi:hypothetical protein DTY60_24220 [Escherichia coli]|nr:hypothetical protein [Escherichia coli]
MNDELDFAIGYELLTDTTEQLLLKYIKKLSFDEFDKVYGIYELWNILALRGVMDVSGFKQINVDRKRFESILHIEQREHYSHC